MLAKGGQPKKNRGSENPSSLSTLAEQGIDKNLAKSARKLAAMSDRCHSGREKR